MKARYLMTIIWVVLSCIPELVAQNNVLSIPDVSVAKGKSIALPVNMENMADVVALQFTITVPEGITLDPASAVLTERSDGHSVHFQNTGVNKYMAMVFSSENKNFKGRSGRLLNVTLRASDSLEEGAVLPLSLSNVVLGARDGSNIMTGFSSGNITIAKAPDLEVSNVIIEESHIAPNETISVGWQVENIGGLPTTAGWSEQIIIEDNNGTSKTIGTLYYDQPLNPEGLISRNAELVIPTLPGIDGEAKIRIRLTPNSDAGEPVWLQNNNVAVSGQTLLVEKMLSIIPANANIDETDTNPLRFMLTRSGKVINEEVFVLNQTPDPRLLLPESVSIPEGQSGTYFYAQVKSNGELDNDSIVDFTVSGNGYPELSSRIIINDDVLPSLSLSTEATDVTEGESITFTISTQKVALNDIEVKLYCDLPSRFTIPSDIRIPAGQQSVNVEIKALENDLPEVEEAVTFTAAAQGHNTATFITILIDNDLPNLLLELYPDAISEGAGPLSIAATLSRTDNLDKAVTIKLTDDSNGNIYYGRNTIEMKSGVREVTINLGPVDNSIVDGERTYNVTAAVWIPSCSCDASGGTSGGKVTMPLTIFDNDGPSLSVTTTHPVLKEGSEMSVTVSRNTDTNSELNVTVSCDNDTNIDYPSVVTIPSGERAATFVVRSIKDDNSENDVTALLTVEAEGYSKDNLWFLVSDQTLPDARITSIEVSESKVEVGENVTVSITLKNSGALALPELTKINYYREGDSKVLYSSYLQSDLNPGDSVIISKEITLPNNVGRYKIFAVVNEDHEIKELIFSNNTSDNVDVDVVSPYIFNVSADKDVYSQNDQITISGNIWGNNIALQEIELYIINDGYRHSEKIITDENGMFSLDYRPYSGQIGHFDIGACYPGEGLTSSMASFDIYGIKRDSKNPIYCESILGTVFEGEFHILNPSYLPLSNVSATILSKPDNCIVDLICPTEIDARTSMGIKFKISPLSVSEGNDWQKIVVSVSTKEGVSLDVPINYYCYSESGKLTTSVPAIKTTMIKGKYRDYPFEILNIGKGITGKISLSIPDWMSSATPLEMASLDKGESATVILRLIPDDKMQLNVPVTGQIGINCENGEGLALPFSIEPVSESVGILTIDVCDEYSYYTSEAPHVSGAEVRISHPTTGALITSGVTDENGLFSASINEGYYAVSVTADLHDSYSNNILVDPGKEKNITVNLSVESITVNYTVEETEVEDEYHVVTTVNFETSVPTPVVELSVPSSIPAKDLVEGESLIFNAILTNKGLITAEDVQFLAPEGFKYLTFEPLSYVEPFDLAPQQSVVIPVKVTHISNAAGSRVRPIDDDPCVGQPGTLYFWDCGLDRKWHRYSVAMQVGSCKSGDPSTWSNSSNGNYGGGGYYPYPHTGGGSYSSSSSNNNIPTKEVTDCEPCQNQFMLDFIDCAAQLIPAYRTLKAVIACATSTIDAVKSVQDHTPFENLSAFRNVLSTCKSAKGAGAGDNNTSREEKREEAIEGIIDTLKELVENIQEGEADFDSNVEALGSLAQNLSTLAGFDFEHLEELFCPLKLFKPCDKEGSNGSIPAGNDSPERLSRLKSYPSYIQEFQNALALPFINQMTMLGIEYEFYGDISWLSSNQKQLNDFHEAVNFWKREDGTIPEEAYELLLKDKPENVSKNSLYNFLDRWNNSLNNEITENSIDYEKLYDYIEVFNTIDSIVAEKGYDSFADYFEVEYDRCKKEAEIQSNAVCSSITMQFSQKMTMTRQAFRGTLSVFNGNETSEMRDVRLSLTIKDENGNLATDHEFQIAPETLDGFNGQLDLLDGWSLGAQKTGKATILFIPTKFAAPTVGKVYHFGGSLSYIDPFTGLEVTRTLTPVALTVNPSPNLNLTYFMQRDVIGDDPLTTEVEPCEEAEFALLVNNIGYGEATNVRMVTEQPEIIDNEKGLPIEFKLISSQLNGGDKTLALGGNVPTEFGNLPALGTSYAQWWFTSSFLGHFTDYNIEATHITSYGNPDLSLLNEVTIHELIRSLEYIDTEDRLVGFLTNDIADAGDTPDMIYLSNGEVEEVSFIENADFVKSSDNDYLLKINPVKAGWNYGNISDPTYGTSSLKSVIRQSDGKDMSLRNFWQTDRTLRDGKDPLYENRIHFADKLASNQEETYILTFEPKPKVELEVECFTGVPENGTVLKEQLREVTVVFNKPVREESFSTDDITLYCQGSALDVSHVAISKVSETEYKLRLGEVTLADGFYVLTVQTAGILDAEGFGGSTGKYVSWIQYVDGKVVLKLTASPAEGGSILPESGRFDYDSDVTVKATAADGYDFTAWMLDNVRVSTDSEYTHHLMEDTELKALFSIKHFNVMIDYDSFMGVVEGASSGIYEYGSLLDLIAIPYDGFVFDSWLINGENVSDKEKYTITVNNDISVNALFKDSSDGIESIDVDDLRVKIRISDSGDMMYISGNFNEILMVNIFNMRGTLCISTQNVDPHDGISTDHLNTGIYYVQVMTDKGLYNTKVLKQ